MIEGLSARLKKQRKQIGLSQKQVGDNIGKSGSTIADYEEGRVDPPATVLAKIATLYKCTSDYLLGIEDLDSGIRPYLSGIPDNQADSLIALIKSMKKS